MYGCRRPLTSAAYGRVKFQQDNTKHGRFARSNVYVWECWKLARSRRFIMQNAGKSAKNWKISSLFVMLWFLIPSFQPFFLSALSMLSFHQWLLHGFLYVTPAQCSFHSKLCLLVVYVVFYLQTYLVFKIDNICDLPCQNEMLLAEVYNDIRDKIL